jgi:Tfp pilus assembly protein PilF
MTLLLLASIVPARAQPWYAVQSRHVIAYSEANGHAARDAVRSAEQTIGIFAEIFHRKDIAFAAPLVLITGSHQPLPSPVVRTPLAVYLAVDPSQPDASVQVARAIAAITLEDNYPRAEPWFDAGVIAYLSAIRFAGDQMEFGAPPLGVVIPAAAEWLPFSKLVTLNDAAPLTPAERQAFDAESWALVRWIIANDRMAQAGEYLNAVEWRGATPERALAEAFSMSFADLDREVRESVQKQRTETRPALKVESMFYPERKVPPAEIHVLKANLTLFDSGGDAALHELVGFMQQNQESAAVHRSLAWAFLERHDLENAMEHVRRALALDDSDPAMHYLYALLVNQADTNVIHFESAVPRLGTELKAALRRDPSYAAAMELLGLAELSDHALKPALQDLQHASALRPRDNRYYLNLARAYEASGNHEAARNLALYVRSAGNATLSGEAAQLLNTIGAETKETRRWAMPQLQPQAAASHSKYDNLDEAIAEDEAAEAAGKKLASASDDRRTEHMRGRILKVECSAEAATLQLSAGEEPWTIRVADRSKAVLIGTDRFDCSWRNVRASINYKRSGERQGDLVSLEIVDGKSAVQ